jgi:hypothetical protein
VVLPLSFFERANNAHFNSLAMMMPTGSAGALSQSHIPDGRGIRRSSTQSRGHGFRFNAVWRSGRGHCWDCGARKRAGDGATGLRSLSTHRQRAATGAGRRFVGPLAARDAGACGCELYAADRFEPDRARNRRELRDHVLRHFVHRRAHGRDFGRRGARYGGGDHSDGRFTHAAARNSWGCSATGGRALCAADVVGWLRARGRAFWRYIA